MSPAPITASPLAAPATALEVRERLVEALELDLVGPPAGHDLAEERLPGWVRPSTWYLTGFLMPVDAPAEERRRCRRRRRARSGARERGPRRGERGRGGHDRQEGLLPVLAGAELARSGRGRRADASLSVGRLQVRARRGSGRRGRGRGRQAAGGLAADPRVRRADRAARRSQRQRPSPIPVPDSGGLEVTCSSDR